MVVQYFFQVKRCMFSLFIFPFIIIQHFKRNRPLQKFHVKIIIVSFYLSLFYQVTWHNMHIQKRDMVSVYVEHHWDGCPQIGEVADTIIIIVARNTADSLVCRVMDRKVYVFPTSVG